MASRARTWTPSQPLGRGCVALLLALDPATLSLQDRPLPVPHFATRVDLPAEGFSTRSTDRRFELPLADVQPGAYLLTIDGSAGDRAAHRSPRFWVRP